MNWKQVAATEYNQLIDNNYTLFHSTEFNILNKEKAEDVLFLVNCQKSANYGLILGKIKNTLKSPFSSPFGGIVNNGKFTKSELDTISASLVDFVKSKNYSLQITFPPFIYDTEFLEECTDSISSVGFTLEYTDLNFHLDLDKGKPFLSIVKRNAKKNFKNAMKYEHKFYKAASRDEMLTCYRIIQTNRSQRGFPLKLAFEDIMETKKVIPIDFFVLNIENTDSAAAIVFNISEDKSIVVYWGNNIETAHFRPMNLLPYYLYNYYTDLDKKILDIGPSSEQGVLNEGLASFKKSIGCLTSQKHTFKFINE